MSGRPAIRFAATAFTALALALPGTAYGQGHFYFNNRAGDASEGPLPFRLCTDVLGPSSIAGSEWQVRLFGGPAGTAPTELQPLVPAFTTFRTGNGAGYVFAITVTVPNVAPRQLADVMLQVVYAPQDLVVATFGPFQTRDLGGDGNRIPVLGLGNDPLCIPEPGTFVLAVFAMGLGWGWGWTRRGAQLSSYPAPHSTLRAGALVSQRLRSVMLPTARVAVNLQDQSDGRPLSGGFEPNGNSL